MRPGLTPSFETHPSDAPQDEGRMMRKLIAISAVLLLAALAAPAAYAVQPDEIMTDPAKEARAREQSRDLRLLVRERIAGGDSDSQVIDFLVARYGEFVLLKPRLTPHTLLLWLLPPLALFGGGLALWFYSRRRAKFPGTEDPGLLKLTAEEEA